VPRVNLTPTSYTVLGMVAAGQRTGYEIARVIERSTRFFWAASEGQIYPELRRLSENGYLRASHEPRGERPKIVYSLTAAGRRELRKWLVGQGELKLETRDEGLLKLFLGEDLTVAEARDLLARWRAPRERVRSTLASVEPSARERPGWFVAQRTGLVLTGALTAWIDRLARALDGADPDAPALPLLAAAAEEV
jgi:PadR family transcriptional regulator, regulatory protein AphA